MKLISRMTELHELPLPGKIEVLHPESVILRFNSDKSVDIGSICYRQRSEPGVVKINVNGSSKAERLVEINSFDKKRCNFVARLIDYCSSAIKFGGKRPETVSSSINGVMTFMDWSDSEGYEFSLQDINVCRNLVAAYIEYLRNRVRGGEIANNTAAQNQLFLLDVLSDIYSYDNLAHGLNLLQIKKHSCHSTQPPPEEDQGRVLALCQCLFEGLSDLVLNNQKYPHALRVPRTMGAKNDQLWIFPSKKWCMPPHELINRESLKQGFWAFDYENGMIAAPEDIWFRYTINPERVKRTAPAKLSIRSARKDLEAANSDAKNRYRLNAALFAHNAFLVLFVANTGINWAPLRQLKWNENYEVGTERQGYRSIKFRSNGRKVSFEIQSIFLKTFKRFLDLRTYLLKDKSFDYLFFASGNFVKDIHPLFTKTLSSIIESLQRLDPDMPSIMSRQWRAGKSDWLLRNTDPATTARILQNSEETVLRSYAEGSLTSQMEEMGCFFDQIQRAVINRGSKVRGSISSALGCCSSFGTPKQISSAPIQSDCHSPEGCLFCDKYKVHADEKDVRKLLSCKFCLQNSAQMASSEEQFQELFGPILKRIDQLLEEISRRESSLVSSVKKEVDKGELDSYWAGKYEMLMDLKLVV